MTATIDPPSAEAPVPEPSGATDAGSRPWLARHWFAVGLVLVVALAGFIRWANVVIVRPTCIEDLVQVAEARGQGAVSGYDFNAGQPGCFGINGDAAYSYFQGRLLAEGHGFVDGASWFASGGQKFVPSAGDPPVYALILGGLSKIGFTSGTSQRLASSLFGVLGVALIALVGRRIAGRRAGLIAGLLAATYPLLWINDGMLLSESVYVPVVALVLLAAYRMWDRPGWWSSALLGGAIALAALTRAEALLLFAVLVIPLLWGIRSIRWTRRGLFVLVSWGVGLLVMMPWFAYNLSRFEIPSPMTSQTGAVFSAANCDTTYYGDYIGYYANCFDEYVAAGKAQWPDPNTLDESQRDKVSRDAALQYMKENKGALPRVMVTRVLRMFDFYNPEIGQESEPLGQNVRVNWAVEGRGKWASRLGFLEYFVLLPFAVAGTIILIRRRVPVSPLLAMPLLITVSAAFTFGITRYRTPVDIMLTILAAVGIEALLRLRWRAPDTGNLRFLRGDREAPATDDAPETADPLEPTPA